MIKLIASDLDGTLIPNLALKVSDRLFPLIRTLREKGIHFVVASGREYESELALFDEVKDQVSFIAQNGARCFLNGKMIACTSLNPEFVPKILRELKKDGRFEVILSVEDGCYVEKDNRIFSSLFKDSIPLHVVDDLEEVQVPVMKVVIGNRTGDPAVMEPVKNRLRQIGGDEVKVVTTGYDWMDCMSAEVNKGNALLKILEVLDIEPEECMAFGDQYNDIEMLQCVGISYAMKDSAYDVKQCADFVTDSVEDVLEQLLRDMED